MHIRRYSVSVWKYNIISLHLSHADIADVSVGEICCGGDRLRSANRSFLPAPPVTAPRVIVIKL